MDIYRYISFCIFDVTVSIDVCMCAFLVSYVRVVCVEDGWRYATLRPVIDVAMPPMLRGGHLCTAEELIPAQNILYEGKL